MISRVVDRVNHPLPLPQQDNQNIKMEKMKLIFFFIFPALCTGQLMSGTRVDYKTVPGYQYAGDNQVYTVGLL